VPCGSVRDELQRDDPPVARHWERLYAVLDADAAGGAATARLAGALGSRLIQMQLPSGAKDPADLAPLAEGRALFSDAIREFVGRHT
jgi:hypothetical protein